MAVLLFRQYRSLVVRGLLGLAILAYVAVPAYFMAHWSYRAYRRRRQELSAGILPCQDFTRMRLLRGLCSTSARPSSSSTGGT